MRPAYAMCTHATQHLRPSRKSERVSATHAGRFQGRGLGAGWRGEYWKCWMTHCLPEFPQSLPRLYYNEPPNDETRYANIASQNADEDGRPYENVISKNQRCLRGGVRGPCRKGDRSAFSNPKLILLCGTVRWAPSFRCVREFGGFWADVLRPPRSERAWRGALVKGRPLRHSE